MLYLLNIYFQGQLSYGSGQILESEEAANSFAEEQIKKGVENYPEQNRLWAKSCYSYVITPEEQVYLPNYNL